MLPIQALVVVSLAWTQADSTAGTGIAEPVARPAKSASSPADPGPWLVHLARHEGHLVGRTDARRSALRVLSLLQAATQASPNTADAYRWTYDLLSRLGRADAAREALRQYTRLRSDDESARIHLMELELDNRQTAQARADYIRVELDRGQLARTYESELRRVLARFAYERRQNEDAAREVEGALRLNPANIRARELAYEMFAETEPALQRVELGLQMIAANPSQSRLAWDLAEFLDQLSLHRHAQEWYNRAIELHQKSGDEPVPAVFRHKLAMSYTHVGDYAKARQAATGAIEEEPTLHVARILRAHASRKLGDSEAAETDLDMVASAYEARIDDVIEDDRSDVAADMAWFFCYHRPDKDRALRLATVAMTTKDPTSLARLAMGYALRMQQRDDDAIAILKPLAGVDQLAALEYAKALIERGQKPRALTVLHKAALLQLSGIGYEMIRDLLEKHDEVAPQRPVHSKIVKALERFDRRVFDYHKRPAEMLGFSIRFADDRLAPAGPVRVVFRIENRGPFPITFGDGFMARPLVAVGARIGQGPGKFYDNYLQVMMGTKPVLMPGDAIERVVSIDVGPVRQHLLRTVSTAQAIEVSAMFDPVYRDGGLAAGLGTITAKSVAALRPALEISPPAIAALANRAAAGNMAERAAAADRLGALLADVEHTGPQSAARSTDLDTVRSALVACLTDPDWQVRAHALVACGWSRLDDRLTNAAAHTVRDKNPIVRMLAVRLFAEAQGEKFHLVLDALAKSDPDRLVRIMARSFLAPTPRVAANGDQAGPTP